MPFQQLFVFSNLSGNNYASGVNYGCGLTKVLQMGDDKNGLNIRWADTPGLADVKISEMAAEAISNGFKDAMVKKRAVNILT